MLDFIGFKAVSGISPLADLAVVPVFVNTGAALLPALIAALASFFTLLLHPGRLIRLCIEKPLWPLAVVAGLLAAGAVLFWPGPTQRPSPDGQTVARSPRWAGPVMTAEDWLALARRLAEQEQQAQAQGVPGTKGGSQNGGTAGQSHPSRPADDTVGRPARHSPRPSPSPPSTGGNKQPPDRPLFFRGGNLRHGYLGGPDPLHLRRRWAFVEPYAMFWSSPMVRDGRVYAAWCMLDPPDNFGAVLCLSADSGRVLWLTEMKDTDHEFGGFFSSPALSADGRYLVIGQGLHPDYDSQLVCLETDTGRVHWLLDCPLHIESSPAIAGDIVVAGAGAVEDPATGKPRAHSDPAKDRHPGYVFAAHLPSGRLLWQYPVNDPESSPAISDGVVYIGSGFQGNAVVALRLEPTDEQLKADGLDRLLWKTPTPYPATGAVTVAGDLVLVGCGNGDYVFQAPRPAGAVLAMDKKTGQVRWQVAMPDGVLGPIAVQGRRAIVPVRNGQVMALDLSDQAEQQRIVWQTTVRAGSRLLAGPAFTGRHVYVLTHDGFLVVLDAADGRVLESCYVNDRPGEMGMSIASPLVAGGRVYVGSENGGLRCYESGP